MNLRILVWILFVFIAGCSKEPSDIEVKALVEQALHQELSEVVKRKILGVDLSSLLGIGELKINEIQKVSCQSDTENTAICEVFIDIDYSSNGGIIDLLGGLPQKRKITRYRFMKVSGEWRVIDPPAN